MNRVLSKQLECFLRSFKLFLLRNRVHLFSAFLFSLSFPSLLNGQTSSFNPTYDTLRIDSISKSILHIELIEHSFPWTIDILKIDLSDPTIRFETVSSGDKIRGYEKTSDMLLRSTYEDEVKVAVNGDFYRAAGVSVGAQVSRGELVKTPDRNWQLLSISNSNEVLISDSFYEGIVSFQSGKSVDDDLDTLRYPITSVNPDSLFDHQIAFFNRFYGSEIPKQKGFKNYVLEPLSSWIVNRPIHAVITSVKREDEDLVLGKDSWNDQIKASVLSFDSTTFAPLSRLGIGDTIAIQHTLTEKSLAIYSAIGGNQRIITNGEFTGDWPERHPRTGVGIDYHSNHLYLITVDGRQETSLGMTLRELSDLMLRYGIDDAINLDGGGSTTMVIQGAVVNQPSDKTGERTVSNALLVVQRKTQ